MRLQLNCISEDPSSIQLLHRRKQIENLNLICKALSLENPHNDLDDAFVDRNKSSSKNFSAAKSNAVQIAGHPKVNGIANSSSNNYGGSKKNMDISMKMPVSSSTDNRQSITQTLRATRKATGSLPPPKVQIAEIGGGDSDPEIEVIEETKSSDPAKAKSKSTTAVANRSTLSSNKTNAASGNQVQQQPLSKSSKLSKGNPMLLLNVIVRPRNIAPYSVNNSRRKELDSRVKVILMKSPTEFVEWLLRMGLIRRQQFCAVHKSANNKPAALKLGLFSDPKLLTSSGGYMWIGECCGKKYISVYSGSIFGSTPIDKVLPTAVLKLIYHWSCQTSITNVETWVKVSRAFVGKMYHYFRCVCSIMLHEKVYDFGFENSHVELGIVSLGTTTADGQKKAVKVEILGLYDRRTTSYRLFASTPEPSNNSRERFLRILKPLRQVVHKNAKIICDQSVDPTCLHSMGYSKVEVCYSSDNEKDSSTNSVIMFYLRKHVPKMFQSSLSLLTENLIQLSLDELCWREKFAHTASSCYDAITEHITYITTREMENHGLLPLLEFVSEYPHNNFRYKSKMSNQGLPSIPTSIVLTPTSLALTVAPSQYDCSTTTVPSMNNKVMVNPVDVSSVLNNQNMLNLPVSNASLLATTTNISLVKLPDNQPNVQQQSAVSAASKNVAKESPKTPVLILPSSTVKPMPSPFLYSEDYKELEPHFYGSIKGNDMLGLEYNNYVFKCHICSATVEDNVCFYDHLKRHLCNEPSYLCNYCVEKFSEESKLRDHESAKHLLNDPSKIYCRICCELFANENLLRVHMTRKHVMAEVPYRCEVCSYATSFYHQIIDHFEKKHRRTPYVMCHFCLSVKTMTSAGAKSFSYRLYTHILKHSHRINCKSCVLVFYSNYLLQDHKKDHNSCSELSAFEPYSPPENHKMIKFKSSIMKKSCTQLLNSSSGNIMKGGKHMAAMSVTLNPKESITLNLSTKENSYLCFECETPMSSADHYSHYRKCTKCSYHTGCQNMIINHSQVFHPPNSKKPIPYDLGNPIILPSPVFCKCGFSSSSGNHMAGHLVRCPFSGNVAYPSENDGSVSSGDSPSQDDSFTLDMEDYSAMPLSVEIAE